MNYQPQRADWQSADDYEAQCEHWRAERWRDESAHVEAWRASEAYQLRPFRFEDLNGKPEPASWGPAYPKTASAAVEKWRAIARGRELNPGEACLYGQAVHAWIRALNAPKRDAGALPVKSNSASGQAGEFDAAKYRASMKARFHAQAAADRLAWATGKLKDSHGRTIRQAYAAAMAEKRARLAACAQSEAFARAKLKAA